MRPARLSLANVSSAPGDENVDELRARLLRDDGEARYDVAALESADDLVAGQPVGVRLRDEPRAELVDEVADSALLENADTADGAVPASGDNEQPHALRGHARIQVDVENARAARIGHGAELS